ncbi:amidohydrolase family protein [Gammaproteobacteria bacterium]|nr:amidohydrolase family protein [Gammaproteobacteria bacterium]
MKKVLFTAVMSVFYLVIHAKTVIHAGYLFDADTASLEPEMTIVIEENIISDVGAGYISPESDDLYIDLTGYYILPGLIDMHVHLTSQSSSKAYIERTTLNSADYAIRATKNAEKTLLAGFTSVRNLGDADSITISLRNAINNGVTFGPRIFSSGTTISTTGGHGDPTNSLNLTLTSDPGPREGVINGKKDAYKAVRHRYKQDADLIKITATGGVLSNAKNGQNPQMTVDEIKAIVASAKDYGFKVAAHAHGSEGIKRATLAGVDSIEHGTLMDKEGASLMRERGTYYVPTLLAGKWVADKALIEGYYPPFVEIKALEIGPQLQATFSMANQAGLKIAFGTDSGVSPHGENAKEFKLMIDAGMTEKEAILSATLNAADLLGKNNEIGSLSKGKLADLIAVSKNPLEDITILETVDFVMKGGVVVKQP